jgi:hypothetical protein
MPITWIVVFSSKSSLKSKVQFDNFSSDEGSSIKLSCGHLRNSMIKYKHASFNSPYCNHHQ